MATYFTPQTLAEYLDISKQTIYNRLATGNSLPVHTKVGRLVRFSPSDVEAWLQDNRQINTDPVVTKVIPTSAPRRRGRPTKAEQVRLRA